MHGLKIAVKSEQRGKLVTGEQVLHDSIYMGSNSEKQRAEQRCQGRRSVKEGAANQWVL